MLFIAVNIIVELRSSVYVLRSSMLMLLTFQTSHLLHWTIRRRYSNDVWTQKRERYPKLQTRWRYFFFKRLKQKKIRVHLQVTSIINCDFISYFASYVSTSGSQFFGTCRVFDSELESIYLEKFSLFELSQNLRPP